MAQSTKPSEFSGKPSPVVTEERPPAVVPPRIIVTGASGFVGRCILHTLKNDFRIVGMARRSQRLCEAPIHGNINWHQVDLGDRDAVAEAFDFVRKTGGADYVIHLAAHYDFTGEKHPEYRRTSVGGLRNVLEACRGLDLKRFIFASSVVASRYPKSGSVLNEKSPADGEHVYAVSKGIGERMLAEYDDDIPSCIVRFAALFSDWCEYAPLYVFLETWLSHVWNRSLIGGRGTTALPYLHVREVGPFMAKVLECADRLEQREVLIAGPSETISHLELFNLANIDHFGRRRRPFFIPKPLARLGVWGRDLLGRVLGKRPFERPWMVRYLDTDLAIDASHTYERLDWKPRKRLALERRIAFMVEHRKTDPGRWSHLNRMAMKEFRIGENLLINHLLGKHLDEICTAYLDYVHSNKSKSVLPSYQDVSREDLRWRFTVILRQLQSSIRTHDQGLFMAYCADLAHQRMEEGISAQEVAACLLALNAICVDVLWSDDEAQGLEEAISDYLSITMRSGCDQVFETYEQAGKLELEEGL